MAREGIYVGGKEIVRRYVGDKIVWRKSYYAQVFASRGDVNIQDISGLKIEFQFHFQGYSGFTGNLEEGRVELDGRTALFSKLEADIYTNTYNNRTYNRLVFTFANESDKNKFLWKEFINKELRIFKKAYK